MPQVRRVPVGSRGLRGDHRGACAVGRQTRVALRGRSEAKRFGGNLDEMEIKADWKMVRLRRGSGMADTKSDHKVAHANVCEFVFCGRAYNMQGITS